MRTVLKFISLDLWCNYGDKHFIS